MAVLLSSNLPHLRPPGTTGPFLAESPETSKEIFKLATTPSPNVSPKFKRRKTSPRSDPPSPNDSRSLQGSRSSDTVGRGSPRRKDYREPPSGLGLGLGIPVLPNDHETTDEPLISWRFSEISKPSSVSTPTSPSPSESVAGEARTPPDD